jgi:MoxR-like ATPase
MTLTAAPVSARSPNAEARIIAVEPYYEPVGGEIDIFEAAYASQLPVLLKGPTGCGKTRFMEYTCRGGSGDLWSPFPATMI